MTATLSVDRDQPRSIRALLTTDADGLGGAVGGEVSALCATAPPVHATSKMVRKSVCQSSGYRVAAVLRCVAFMPRTTTLASYTNK